MESENKANQLFKDYNDIVTIENIMNTTKNLLNIPQ